MNLFSSRKAQSMLEYAGLVTITILVMVLAGPYVIRSMNAHFKFWDDSTRESIEDPLLQAPLQDLPSDCNCTVPAPAGCGAGECPPTKMLMYSNCHPIGCEYTAGFTTRECVLDPSCCTQVASELCGRGTTEVGDCPVGNRIYTDSCGRAGETSCVAEEECNPRCLGIYAAAAGIESASVPIVCPSDDVNVILPAGQPLWEYDVASNFVGLSTLLKGTSPAVCTDARKCETYCPPGYKPDPSNTRCEGECGTTQEIVRLDTRDFVNAVAPEWARTQGYYLNTHDDFRGGYNDQSIEEALTQICTGYNADWTPYFPATYGCIAGVPYIHRHNGDWEFNEDGQGWCGGAQALEYVNCLRTVPIACPACAPICGGTGPACGAEINVTFQLEYFGGDTQCRKGRSATPHTITVPVAPMEPNTMRRYVITTDPKVRKQERCGTVYCPFTVTANASGTISGPSTSVKCHKAAEDTECFIKSYPDIIYRSGRKGNGWRDIRLYQRNLE